MNLEDLLDRPIAFHRCFVTLTGSVSAAIMLSQAWYWTRRTKDEGKWFYKTREQWEEETGLTRFEQESARKSLRGTGFWIEERRGVPAQLYFRIDQKNLQSRLLENSHLDGGKVASKKAGNQPSFTSSETTQETTPEITVEALDESTPPTEETTNPKESYSLAKRIYRRHARGQLGNLGERHGEAWASLLGRCGEDVVLGALEIWAKEVGPRGKDLSYPIAVFLKNAEEYVEAFQMEKESPAGSEEDDMPTAADLRRERYGK